MPVNRLTADCIWNSFLNSTKRHIVITGSKSRGKTTLLSELFPTKTSGLTSEAIPKKAVYLKENLTENIALIGTYNDKSNSTENKMTPVYQGFLSTGIQAVRNCISNDSQWITIDEIGYLEESCDEYLDALRLLLTKKQVACVARKQNLPFLNELKSRDDVFYIDLDKPFGNIGCIIMASGNSRRFGENKLLADFCGKPLFSFVLDATEDIFSQRAVVTRHKEIAEICNTRKIKTVVHSLPYKSDTIRLGIEALNGVDRCMFIPADQPLISKETVYSLALSSLNEPDFIWRTVFKKTQCSPVIFPKAYFTELAELKKEMGGNTVIKNHIECLRTISVSNEYELYDIDYPDDLIKLKKLCNK